VVRGALVFERERLSGALKGLIDAEDARSLARLLADDEGLHQITTILGGLGQEPRHATPARVGVPAVG
jgi:hypothetical protein